MVKTENMCTGLLSSNIAVQVSFPKQTLLYLSVKLLLVPTNDDTPPNSALESP